MSTEHDEITRAEAAKRILAEPLLAEALDTIEREIVDMWAACPARDVEGREELWKFNATARKFRALLLGYIETGKLAKVRLEEKSAAQRIRAVFRG